MSVERVNTDICGTFPSHVERRAGHIPVRAWRVSCKLRRFMNQSLQFSSSTPPSKVTLSKPLGQQHRMARPQSAAEKVFGIAELLEQILLVAAHDIVESSWGIRETLEPVAFLSRIQMVNRSSRAITIGSSKLQHILQDPVDLLSSCPYCGSDEKLPHPNKSHMRWTCPLSRHYEPILWLLKYQLHNNITGYQDDLQDLYTKGLWFQKDSLGIEREEYARRSVEEVPYEFSRYKSAKAASWRSVKVPKTRVIIESPPPRNREHYNHGG